MDKLRSYLLALPRRYKRVLQIGTDVVLVWLALLLAFLVRLGVDDMINPVKLHFWLFVAAPLVAIPLFIRFGMYRAVMRYFGNDALIAIIKAVSLSSLILAVVVYWYSNHDNVVPRSIIFNYWWLSLIMLGACVWGCVSIFSVTGSPLLSMCPLPAVMTVCRVLPFMAQALPVISWSRRCVWAGSCGLWRSSMMMRALPIG